jgi:hypothetical protein
MYNEYNLIISQDQLPIVMHIVTTNKRPIFITHLYHIEFDLKLLFDVIARNTAKRDDEAIP